MSEVVKFDRTSKEGELVDGETEAAAELAGVRTGVVRLGRRSGSKSSTDRGRGEGDEDLVPERLHRSPPGDADLLRWSAAQTREAALDAIRTLARLEALARQAKADLQRAVM